MIVAKTFFRFLSIVLELTKLESLSIPNLDLSEKVEKVVNK